jgi:drug/metabolite transporter (DMT)-like permease
MWLPDVPAAVSSSLIFTLVIPYFFIGLLAGGGQGVLQAETPVSAWLILSFSGIIGIGLGYSFYYQSLKGLGVTLTSSLGLLIPVFTAVISFFVYRETLSPLQIAGSAVLLSGCFVVVRTR